MSFGGLIGTPSTAAIERALQLRQAIRTCPLEAVRRAVRGVRNS
jgi:hypothetical protein